MSENRLEGETHAENLVADPNPRQSNLPGASGRSGNPAGGQPQPVAGAGLGDPVRTSSSDVPGTVLGSGTARSALPESSAVETTNADTLFDVLDRGPAASGTELGNGNEHRADSTGQERTSGAGNNAAAREVAGTATGNPPTGRTSPAAGLSGTPVSFEATGEVTVPSGPRARLEANLAALKIVKDLDSTGRYATADEQKVLASYSSFGASGVSDVFDPSNSTYADIRAELQGLLSLEEYNSIRSTSTDAHFTDPAIAASMWQVLTDAGCTSGVVLEPGCGSGNFMGAAPDAVTMLGVEVDSMTARIASYLYPQNTVRLESFGETRVPPASISAAIGNVPYGNFTVHDSLDNPQRLSIHNHFIHKSMKNMAPGGYGVFLTSTFTMDSQRSLAREIIATHSDLVGAVRLPSGVFSRVAGTDVQADVLVFRRRADGEKVDREKIDTWVQTGEKTGELKGEDVAVRLNQYFMDNPGYILGEAEFETNRFGQPVLVAHSEFTPAQIGEQLESHLDAQLQGADARGLGYAPVVDPAVSLADLAPGGLIMGGVEEQTIPGTVRFQGGAVQSFSAKYMWEPKKVAQSALAEAAALIDLKETVSTLVATATDDSARGEEILEALGKKYDAYHQRYGAINRFVRVGGEAKSPEEIERDVAKLVARWRKDYPEADLEGPRSALEPTEAMLEEFAAEAAIPGESRKVQQHLNFLRQDPDFGKLLALEVFDEDRQVAEKSGYFNLSTFAPVQRATSAENADDALAISMDETGGVNLARIAELLSLDESAAREALGDRVFMDPVSGELEHKVQYLSGDVRVKLDRAREAAEIDSSFLENVQALEQVVPEWVSIEKLTAQPGAQFISEAMHSKFIEETFGVSVPVAYSEFEGRWKFSTTSKANLSPRGLSEFGTNERNPLNILEAVMNNRSLTVRVEVEGKSVVNQSATMLARAKANAVKERFNQWLRQDSERIEVVENRFNYMLNSDVAPDYSSIAQGLKLEGLNPEITPRPYQSEAVARIRHSSAVLLDHTVGAGKTGTMIMAAMELRRTGAARKPWLVVPNPLVEQITREGLQWYPNAHILMIPTGLNKVERASFMARAAAGDWDLVVCPQSVFTQVSVSAARQRDYISEQKQMLEEQKREAKGDRLREKDLQRALKSLDARLKRISEAKDRTTFEETGCDYLFIDEAHQYKNLQRISDYRELSCAGSNRATDVDMILRTLRDMKSEQAFADGSLPPVATLATGTPVSNSLAEMWVMGHYVNPEGMKKFGVENINGFGSTFTVASNAIEIEPAGTSFRAVSKINKFTNMEQLMRLYGTYASVVTRDMIPAQLPEVVDGKMVPMSRPSSDAVREYIEVLVEQVKNPGPDDYLVEQLGRARKVALDPRLVGLEADADGGRAAQVADAVIALDEQYAQKQYLTADGEISPVPGGLQVLFCDYSTPKYDGTFNMYDAIKDELVARGMPAHKIAFIHDASNDEQRAELFSKARNGELSVLIGSTEKMGTGVNIQDRITAIYHVDVPWRPSDLEQREGRGIRSGNQNEHIHIRGYVTEKSFDAYMWQLMLNKAKFLAQLKQGDVANEATDIGLEVSASEFVAAASGDPRVMEFMDLDNQVMALQIAAEVEANARANTAFDIASITARLGGLEGSVMALGSVLDYAPHRDSRLQVGSKLFDARSLKAGERILVAVGAVSPQLMSEEFTGTFALGRVGSLPLVLQRDPMSYRPAFALRFAHPVTGEVIPGRITYGLDYLWRNEISVQGLVTRLYNAGERLGEQFQKYSQQQEILMTQLEDLQQFASSASGFSRQSELDELSVKLEALAQELKMEAVSSRSSQGRSENEEVMLTDEQFTMLGAGLVDTAAELREGDVIELMTSLDETKKGIYRVSRKSTEDGEVLSGTQVNLVGEDVYEQGEGYEQGTVHRFMYDTKFTLLNRRFDVLNDFERTRVLAGPQDLYVPGYQVLNKVSVGDEVVVADFGESYSSYPLGVVTGTVLGVDNRQVRLRDSSGAEREMKIPAGQQGGLVIKNKFSLSELAQQEAERQEKEAIEREKIRSDRLFPGDTLRVDAPGYGEAGWVYQWGGLSYSPSQFIDPETGKSFDRSLYSERDHATIDMVLPGRDCTDAEIQQIYGSQLGSVEVGVLRPGDVVSGELLDPKGSLAQPVRIVSVSGASMIDVSYRPVDSPLWEAPSEVRRKESVNVGEVFSRRYGALSLGEKIALVTEIEPGVRKVRDLDAEAYGSWVFFRGTDDALHIGRLESVSHQSFNNRYSVLIRDEDEKQRRVECFSYDEACLLSGDYPGRSIDLGGGVSLVADATPIHTPVEVAEGFGFSMIPGFHVDDVDVLVEDKPRAADDSRALVVDASAVETVEPAVDEVTETEALFEEEPSAPLAATVEESEVAQQVSTPVMEADYASDKSRESVTEAPAEEPAIELVGAEPLESSSPVQIVWCVNTAGQSVEELLDPAAQPVEIGQMVKVSGQDVFPAESEVADDTVLTGIVIANAQGVASVLVRGEDNRSYRVDVTDQRHLSAVTVEEVSQLSNQSTESQYPIHNPAQLLAAYASIEITSLRPGDWVSIDSARVRDTGEQVSLPGVLVSTAFEADSFYVIGVVDAQSDALVEFEVSYDAKVQRYNASDTYENLAQQVLSRSKELTREPVLSEELEPTDRIEGTGHDALTHEPVAVDGIVVEIIEATEDHGEILVVENSSGEHQQLSTSEEELEVEKMVPAPSAANQTLLDDEQEQVQQVRSLFPETNSRTEPRAEDAVVVGMPGEYMASQVRPGDKVSSDGKNWFDVYAVSRGAETVGVTVLASDGLRTSVLQQSQSVVLDPAPVFAHHCSPQFASRTMDTLREGDKVLYQGQEYRIENLVQESGQVSFDRVNADISVREAGLSGQWGVQVKEPLVAQSRAGVQGELVAELAKNLERGDIIRTHQGVGAVVLGVQPVDEQKIMVHFQMMQAGMDKPRQFSVAPDYQVQVFEAHERPVIEPTTQKVSADVGPELNYQPGYDSQPEMGLER